MNSRHTPMSGRLTRSFGIVGAEDLVVELDAADGSVVFRKEPADRKLRRGEQLAEKRFVVSEVMNELGGRPPRELEVTEILEKLLARIPIAKFEGEDVKNLSYSMKVWLMRELKRIITPEEEKEDEAV